MDELFADRFLPMETFSRSIRGTKGNGDKSANHGNRNYDIEAEGTRWARIRCICKRNVPVSFFPPSSSRPLSRCTSKAARIFTTRIRKKKSYVISSSHLDICSRNFERNDRNVDPREPEKESFRKILSSFPLYPTNLRKFECISHRCKLH